MLSICELTRLASNSDPPPGQYVKDLGDELESKTWLVSYLPTHPSRC